MKILQICKKFPYPLKDGESIANTYISKALNNLGCEITLLSMNTSKHYVELESIPVDFDHYQAVHTVKVDNHVSYWKAFLFLIRNESYNVARFISPLFANKLKEILEQEKFDVVQLETAYLSPYIPLIRKHSQALIVMRAHNVEYEIWERMAEHSGVGFRRWYFNHISRQLQSFEKKYLRDYDLLITFTERDLFKYRKMGYFNGALLSPIGLNLDRYNKSESIPKDGTHLAYIGALDWMPNLEGLKWFLNEVWPVLTEKYPKLHFHIAGRNTPPEIFDRKNQRVHIHGEVPDALDFLNKYSLLIVPLFSGSGMRVKILEGMALGKVVVTTTIGMEGIPAQNNKDILIADNAEEFVDQISHCIDHPKNIHRIGDRASLVVKAYFDNHHIARQLLQTYKEEIENHRLIPV